jgi:hypothetical protein
MTRGRKREFEEKGETYRFFANMPSAKCRSLKCKSLKNGISEKCFFTLLPLLNCHLYFFTLSSMNDEAIRNVSRMFTSIHL